MRALFEVVEGLALVVIGGVLPGRARLLAEAVAKTIEEGGGSTLRRGGLT